MKVLGGDTKVFAALLALVAIGVVNCQSPITSTSTIGYPTSCRSGDYYIVAQILGIHVAYSTKYHNTPINPNCPVAVLASHIYVHCDGNLVYIWNKDCGTLGVILTKQLAETLYNQLYGIDFEQMFNELVGINGIPMSYATSVFADTFLSTLEYLLDQRNGDNQYLINFNAIILYTDIFAECGFYFNVNTSPLCDLLLVTCVQELLPKLDIKSTLISFLRSTTSYPSTDPCLKYVFGALNLLNTVPYAIYCLYTTAGLPTYNVDFYQLAYKALTVGGLNSCVKEVLPYIFCYYSYIPKYTIIYG
ncbi:hypothetical protein DMENIID0001_030650 [Sergentomyia squamirostris]